MSKQNTKNAYSPWKIAHHPDKIDQLRKKEQPVPLQVQITLSDLCNQNCSFCAYRMENYTTNQLFGEKDKITGLINNNPNRMIPYDKCIEILNDCKDMGVKALQYTGGGEPTVHPKHKEIFQHTLDLGLDLSLITNGVLMRPGMPEILSQGSWVRFSLDAAKKESYSSIREVSEDYFEKVLKHIKQVVDARNKNKESNLVIGIGFVVTQDNYKEIREAGEIAKDLGVDNIRISAIFTPKDFEYHKNIYPRAKEESAKLKSDLETEKFKVFNLFGDRIEDLIQQKPDYNFCGFMHLNTWIGGDLNIYTCCNNAYNEIGKMGSIKKMSFKEFWNSKEKKEKYKKFNAKGCERCMFNNKNRFIEYLIEDNPTHINYI